MRAVVVAIAMLAGGCTYALDVEPIDRTEFADATKWPITVIATGYAPGHGDTYRVIHGNAIAASKATNSLRYNNGSIFAKEVFDHEGGTLEELVVMRKVNEEAAGFEDEGGWLFAIDKDNEERESYRCWRNCHVAAPYRGLWLRY